MIKIPSFPIIIFIAFIIIILALAASKALFHPGFYTSHDGEHQLVRQYVFDQGLRDGQIPVRVSRQLYNGYGYPLFMFTYRLPFYFGEVFRLVGFSYADSIKGVFVVAYIASGLTMFWFAKRWGNLAGFLGAFLYLWAPYRFSVMFVRAALGEHVAAVFVPLLFGSISATKKVKINVLLGAISIAGLFLSHAVMAQITLLMFLPWSLGHFILSSEKRRFVWRWALMAVLGLGVAAYYMVPAVAYRGLIQKLNPDYFADHFVTLKQLIYSPWGYAFSMKGTDNDGMSFQVGVAQWMAVVIVVISYLLFVIRNQGLNQGLTFTNVKVRPLAMLFIFGASIFLMTKESAFIWNSWKSYINIDMPWRFLLMTTFSASALAALAAKVRPWPFVKVRPLPLPFLMAIVLVGIAAYANRNHLRVNKYISYPDEKLTQYRGTSNSDNEYKPKWDNTGITITMRPEAQISQGVGELKLIRSKSNLLDLAVKAEENIRLDVNTLYFPGWNVSIDGQPAALKYSGEGGIMRVDIPAGNHLLEAKYQETALAKIANMISLGSVAMLFIIGFRYTSEK